MSETKHTPGPWHVRFGGRQEDDGWCVASQSSSDPIVVAESWPRVMPPRSQLIANARLIAAAPELLAALKDTLCLAEAYFDTLPDDGEAQDHYMASVIEPARNAIAKAEGREA